MEPNMLHNNNNNWACIYRADSRFAPSQWEREWCCNDVSQWLGTSLESVLIYKHIEDWTKWLIHYRRYLQLPGICMNENIGIFARMWLKFVPKGSVNYKPALVHVMAWHRTGNKPLLEPYPSSSIWPHGIYHTKNANKKVNFHFPEGQVLHFDSNFTEVCPE